MISQTVLQITLGIMTKISHINVKFHNTWINFMTPKQFRGRRFKIKLLSWN